MRLLILDENYPHADNLLGSVFTHVRVKEYAKSHKVRVFSFFHKPGSLNYEGIDIELFGDIPSLKKAIDAYKPEKIIIHFFKPWMFEELVKVQKVPLLIWIHGYEVIGWYRRLYNWNPLSPLLIRNAYHNIQQQATFRKFIRYANRRPDIRFIFVSEWMRRIAEYDTLSRIRNFSVIPNPIDTDLFPYRIKSSDKRTRVLLLRSFESRKYANDISVRAIQELSRRPVFGEFEFRLIGVNGGKLFDEAVAPLRSFTNISFLKQSIPQREIPDIHAQYGIFLCPTRQDSQGVSMCEAMSSGLVPVTSHNTAIPEFVRHNTDGILTRNHVEIADALEDLYHNPEKFLRYSKQASEAIKAKCGLAQVIRAELEEIEN